MLNVKVYVASEIVYALLAKVGVVSATVAQGSLRVSVKSKDLVSEGAVEPKMVTW